MGVRGAALGTTELQRKYHKKNSSISTGITMVLLIAMAAYILFPLYWLVISTTKNTQQLFNTNTFSLPDQLNLVHNVTWLSTYQGGIYWHWALNSVIYACITALFASLFSTMAGYAIAKYQFKWKKPIFFAVLGALMIPHAAMTIPVFLMVRSLGLINTYIGVILPLVVNPFGVYFMSVFIQEAMPSELIDAGRVDGATDYGIFFRIALAIIRPGFITLFLIAFIGTWNNFFLPLVLLSKSNLYPLTVGLSIWTANLNTPGTGEPLYPLILVGSLFSILPMLVLFPILRKYIASGITMGSVKS